MQNYQGEIFKGEFIEGDQAFQLTGVKQLETQSTLSENNLKNLYKYLLHQREIDDTCTITINDQIPMLLSKVETGQLLNELSEIMKEI